VPVIEVTFAIPTTRKLLILDVLVLSPAGAIFFFFFSPLKHCSFCYYVVQLKVVYAIDLMYPRKAEIACYI